MLSSTSSEFDLTWRQQAACISAKEPPTSWFPANELDSCVLRAIEICERCPVFVECIDEGERLQEWHTIRGGISGPERRKLSSSLQS